MQDEGKGKIFLPVMAELWQETVGWQPDEQQQTKFQRLYELILEGNQKLNLTRITEPQEFWEKHLWDSLRGIAFRLKDNKTPVNELTSSSLQILDIGTGAGFPGLPVAIALPHATVTLLDSTRKKIAFLDSLIPELSVENVKTLVGRAEQMRGDRQHREQYDLALIRAVGSASACAEYALPLLKPGGSVVLYRGQWTDAEATELAQTAERFNGKLDTVEEFTTPLTQGIRHCIAVQKVSSSQVNLPRKTASSPT
ncbi:16S rRNA (guanine(527)-N(7))-methyltransferase RsmG [Leptolyngbya sp. FACHB-671]|uniref:16S rRNA (guanine(527)-N(7))-methyltransferase RsmG n=1 Tax=Leptolyngbya sp. FACHB-671 TaxID=2692812 RepID=UPI001682FE92|nr:16S rRNA (guanine(527)-N(7))-methyltransferase RsmG [Leptolyngbya sp. FACHB-671]MBD2069427.1 16S rRNA (guanine(527)-N(7))-methyltransferase RsmG [Leptolyngbya sp. FACHB-671]